MIPVVLSGGSGARLWPVSRESYPKQFCDFFDRSFLRQTVERVMQLGPPRLITLESMKALTTKAIAGLNIPPSALVLEPYGKNTAAAIGLIVHILKSEGLANEVVGVFPADHMISNEDEFLRAARVAEKLAQDGAVVTLGIEPRYAATGYGYLQIDRDKKAASGAFSVKQFFEKPTAEKAETYLASGEHFWNAGVFFFRVDKMAALIEQHLPDLAKKLNTLKPDLSNLKIVYANLISKSIDYGVIEKLREAFYCIPCDCGWSDVGSWDELARLGDENIKIESQAVVRQFEAGDNFVYSSHGKVVGLCAVNNLIVVDTPDALLIAQRGQSQKVRQLVDVMRENHTPQVDEHMFEVRPWGGFDVLVDSPNHKVKRLKVDPGAQMSYQVHTRRDEHWVVVSGEAEIVMEDKSYILRAGQQVFAPRGQKHRIRNSGKTPLVIIEVQTGDYFGEDDITRISDDYNRV
jgi:mannose-1-phosphate guanylyltransferase/mannose-6-phosphate isomerase